MNRFQELAELYRAQAARADQQAALYQQQMQSLQQAYQGVDWQDCYSKVLQAATPAVRDAMQGKLGHHDWPSPDQARVLGAISDPDGPPVPLPQKPAYLRTITAPTHDYLTALRRPYEPIA